MKASALLNRVLEKMKEKNILLRQAVYESYEPQLTSEERGDLLAWADRITFEIECHNVQRVIDDLSKVGR